MWCLLWLTHGARNWHENTTYHGSGQLVSSPFESHTQTHTSVTLWPNIPNLALAYRCLVWKSFFGVMTWSVHFSNECMQKCEFRSFGDLGDSRMWQTHTLFCENTYKYTLCNLLHSHAEILFVYMTHTQICTAWRALYLNYRHQSLM